MAHLITVKKDVNESEQSSSYQNGTLQTVIEGVAMTVETHIEVPPECKTQNDVEKYITSLLSVLSGRGVVFNIALGKEDHS